MCITLGRKLIITQLDACSFLLLCEVSEIRDNGFRVVIEEGRTADTPEDISIGGVTISGTYEIKHDDLCRVFEIAWDSYISYSVTNESYAQPEEKLKSYTGNRVRRYTHSAFLDYVRRATFATAEYPGPFEHLALICERHIIDVISTTEPRVSLLKAARPRSVKAAQPGSPPDALPAARE